MFSLRLLVLLTASILISILHVTLAARTVYGDGTVILYKDAVAKHQLNIFLGDQFIVEFKLRSSGVDEYNDIASLNITQSVQGISTNVTVLLKRVENYLFNVTSVSPDTSINGRSATTLTKSVNVPFNYVTDLAVRNSGNETLSTRRIYRIQISSHHLVTNPGIRVDIFPNP